MPGFFGRDGVPVPAGDEVGVRCATTAVGVDGLGRRDDIAAGEPRAAVGVLTVRVCATCV